jgi:acyl carrier protein
MNELLDEVRQLAADVFSVPLEQITLESSSDSIGNWDSLQHLNLVLGLEQAFDLEFAPEEIERMVTIETIVALVDQKLRG